VNDVKDMPAKAKSDDGDIKAGRCRDGGGR
jgi:hypothetical protein